MSSFSPRTRRFVVSLVITCAIGSAVLFGTITQAEFDPAAMFDPILTATKTDALVATPNNADGKADPGDTIGYTVQINNTGPDPATGVSFNDTIDPNTTLVVGSVAVSAVAVNDVFPTTVIGNVSISSGAFSVLTNDSLGTNPASTITSFDATSTNGGNVTLNLGTGTFTYDPPAGFEGVDTFNYVLSDNLNATSAAPNRTGTVSITVSGMVWFINNTASACTSAASNCGRLSSPYSTLGAFEAENGDADVPATDDFFPAAGDNVFVYESATTYTGGITLLANQRLIGQDAQASLSTITGLTPPSGSPAFPVMNLGAPATTITNAAGNGITLNNGNTVRGLTVSGASASGIAGVGTTNTAIIAGNNDVTITGTTGVAAGNGALAFNGGNGAVTFSGTISGNTGDAVNIRNRTGGITTIQGSVTSSTRGVVLDNNDGATILFTAGLSLNTGANAAFTAINGGTVAATQDNTSVINTLTTTTATALNIANTTISASGVAFRSISSNGATNGVVLNTTGSAGGLTVTGNSAGNCGGTVGAGPPATAAATTAPVIADCTGGTIASSTGPGIILSNTSNVSLTRIRIINGGNDGIQGTNVTGFSLASSVIEGNGNTINENGIDFGDRSSVSPDGLHGTGSVTNSAFINNYYDGLSIRNLNGAALTAFSVTGSQFRASAANGDANDNLLMEALGTGNMALSVSGSHFSSTEGDHIQTAGVNSGTLNVNITNNTFAGGHSTPLGQGITINAATGVPGYSGRIDYDINGNNIQGAAANAAHAILGTSSSAAVFDGFIRNNIIGSSGVALSCSSQANGIGVEARGNGTHNASVTGNTVRQCFDRAILSESGDGSGVLNFTVQSNSLDQQVDAGAREAIQTNYGITSTNVFGVEDAPTICLQLGGAGGLANTFSHGGGAPDDFRLRKRFSATVRLPGYAGGTGQTAPDLAQVVAFIQSQNTGSAGEPGSATASGAGGGYTGGAGCSLPSAPQPADEDAAVVDPEESNRRSVELHRALVAQLAANGGNAALINSGELVVVNPAPESTGFLISLTEVAGRLFSLAVPTVSAQNDSSKVFRPDAPMSGETVSVGPIGTLPAGKSVTITFSVTFDGPVPATEIISRVVNQGTVSSNVPNVLTTDPSPSVDPACTAPPPLGGATCTPVDRPDTSVTSVNRVTTSPTNAASVQWTITFADAVAGLTAANLTLNDTTASCSGESLGTISPVGGGPGATQWTVNANTGTGSCTLRLDIANTGGLSHDVTNVPFTTGQTIVVDKLAPSATSFVRQVPATSPTNADTLVFRATFSENVINVDTADFVPNGTTATVTNVVGVGGGPDFSVYDITVSGGDLAGLNGLVGLDFSGTMNITDIATNALPITEPATDQTYLVDNTPPTVNIVDVSPDPRNTAVASIAINFSEDVTGFNIADLTLTRDGSGNLLPGGTSITGGPANYTLSTTTAVTTADGAYVLTLAAGGAGITDAAGNALALGDTDSWIKDSVAPTVTINQAAGQIDPTFTNPINFTAVFNEPVTDFDDAADVVVTGTAPGVGTATVVITPNSSTNYTVAISGITGDGTIIANIPAGVAIDQANNPNVASTSTDNLVTFITCVPPPANMLAWYTGDGTPSDIAGGFDGTLENGATYGVGKVLQGFSLDGVDDHVAIGDVDLPSTFTIDAWVNPTSLGAERTIVNKDAGLRSFFFNVTSTGALRAVVQSGAAGGVFTQYQTAGGAVTAGSFQHIAVTYDGGAGANNKFRFYVNGVLVPSTVQFSQDNGGTPLNTANPARVGLAFDGTAPFLGVIDELELFTRVLSLAEIQSLFSADGGGKCKPSDLSITKSDANASVVPGGTVSYTLGYTNTGQSATGVVLTETVPANSTFNPGASTAGWACAPDNNAGSACTLNVGSLASLATGSATFAVTVVNPVAAGVTQISNTATISDDGANGTELHTADNTASDTTPVNAQPDFTLTKTDGGATVSPGGTVSYTLNYANAGDQGATGVVLTETVPAHTTFNAGASTAGWSCVPNGNAGSACSLTIGALAGGGVSGSATFALTLDNPVAAGVDQISNTASITDDGSNGADPTPPNNIGTDTTPVIANPDLTLSKSDGGATTIPGGTVAYTLSYSNIGNQGATGVVLTETVPAHTTFNAGASTAGWSCTPNNNAGSTCTLAIGAINGGGASGSATFAVTVDTTGLLGINQIDNTASIADDGTNGADPGGNNTGIDSTPRLCQPIAVTNPALASSLIGLPFSQNFTQSGSFGGSTFTTASTLPGGLTLSTAGVLSGTPTEIGSFPIVVTVTDGNGCTGTSATYNLNITCNVNPVVTNNSDNAVDSLRYAVATACSNVGQNVITFAPGPGRPDGVDERPDAPDVTSPISLSSGQITINRNVVIQGPGADVLTVQNTQAAGATSRVFHVDATVAGATISGLTLSGGNVSGPGGAILHNGGLTVRGVTISGNTASTGGGAIAGSAGLNVVESTISGNNAGSGAGGGIFSTASVAIINSTISGNTTGGNGGGFNVASGTLLLSNSTVTGNNSGLNGGGFFATSGVTIRSSIVAGNTSPGIKDVSGTVTSQGYNLVGIVDGSTGFTGTADQTGTAATPLDPRIAPLASDGGPTQTHALCIANAVPHASCTGLSPAIDMGRDFAATGFDQRGNGPNFVRPFDLPDGTFPDATGGDGSDIGAYELNNTPPTISAIAATRQAGSPSANSQIATAGDIETPIGEMTMTVNGGNTATVNGVTVTLTDSNAGAAGTNPTGSGQVFADVVAACGATTATFTLRVTDTGALFTEAILTVTVTANTPPVLTYSNPAAMVFGQSGVTLNPATGPSDNGSVASIVVQSQGTYTGTVTVDAAGVVTLSGAAPVGVHTITIRATDNCGAQTLAPFQLTVNKANTQTGVQTLMNAPVYGEMLTMTASIVAVAPGAGLPQGTVNFLDGASPIAGCQNVPVNGLGSASCQTNTLPASANKTISAVYSGDANFNGSTGSTQQTINSAILNVTASSHNLTYGDAAPAITNTITGFVLGQTAAVITTQPTCNTTYTQGSGAAASPYPTSCSGAAAPNYTFNYIPGSINVAKKALNVTADNKARGYGAANPPLTATITGFVLGQTLGTSDVTGTPGLSTTATATSPAGAYPITVTPGTLASNNYSFGTFTNGTLTVNSIQLTVTADNKSRQFGAANPPLTFTVTGFVNGEGVGSLTGAPSLSTTANAASTQGNYPITITQGTLTSANYTFTFVNGTLTVTGDAGTTTTITNAASLAANATAVGQAYAVNWSVQPVPPASGTPTGNVTVSDGTGATCTAPASAGTCNLTSTTVGTKTITAAYAGDANFAGSTSQSVQHNVVIGISGNIKQFVPFGTNTNLEGATVTLTNTTTSQAASTTTDASGNYSFGLAVSGHNFVVTPSGLGKTYEPTTRTYNNVTTNITNANFLAYNAPGPGGNPREIRVVNAVGNAGTPVTVPIEVVSRANETRFEFSLSFDNALLGVPTVTCGSNAPGCTLAVNTAIPGRVGITISNYPALEAGTREIARVTFPTNAASTLNTPVSFDDEPTVRDVRDANGDPLPALYRTGFISFSADLEGDVVGPAGTFPGGDGVLANDVTVVRQMVLGLISPSAAQYRYADAAPRTTLGDGCPINAADVTQLGRYNLGSDPPTAVGGPTAPNPGTCAPPTFADESGNALASSRTLRMIGTNAEPGSRVSVQVQMDATGNEAAAGFTVNFNAAMLRYVSAELSVGVPDGTSLAINSTQENAGRLGVLFDSTGAFAVGPRGVMTITFDVLPNAAGSLPIAFSDDVTSRSVSNTNAELIATNFAGGSINVSTSIERTIRGRVTTPSGQGLRNATVTLIEPNGTRRTAVTGSFGLYEFTLVPQGSNTVTVASRRYRFAPRTVTPTDAVTTIDFVGLE